MNHNAAWSTAVAYLASADRTEYELRQALRRKEFAESEIDVIVDKVIELGYLKESELVSRECEMARHRLQGRMKLQDRLNKRGADQVVVDAVLSQADPSEEIERGVIALKTVRPAVTQPFKAAQWLARQGYEEDNIRQILDRTLPGWDEQF